MKLIINADDFGKDEVSTQEITRLIEQGAISSTTIMANGLCLEKCKKVHDAHPEISCGIHLCLSEFDSLTKNPILHKYGITDEKGTFIRLAILKKWYLPKELKQALREELCAQIEYLKSLGFNISHADSHQHVHLHYRFMLIFDSVLKQYGIRKVRRCKPLTKIKGLRQIVSNLRNILVDRVYTRDYITTAAFGNYDAYLQQPAFFAKGDTLELMCHPGHNNPRYVKETEQVAKGAALMLGNNELINYYEL